jgi:hypothetical protein
MLIMYIVSEVIFVPMLVLALLLLIKIFKKYGLKDKPMLFSFTCVVSTLTLLIFYCACNIERSINRDKSFWDPYLRINVLVALGYNIEIFILLGLIFDLYKWQLFIAMTRDSQDGSKDSQQVDREVLQTKIKIYYIFVGTASLMMLTYITLICIFLATTPNIPEPGIER